MRIPKRTVDSANTKKTSLREKEAGEKATMQKNRQAFRIYTNSGGFTLVELMVVIAIIGILATIAVGSFMSTRTKVVDAAALSETRILGKVVLNAFLDGIDVNLSHNSGDGPQIGTQDTAGNGRSPLFTLSNGLVAQITGNSDWGGSGLGRFVAEVWHPNGSKTFWLIIDEVTDTVSFPTG